MGAPLAEMEKDQVVKVTAFESGQAMKKRLKDMGILVNDIVIIVKNDKKGPVIVKAKGAEIVLGRGVSEKIMAEVIDEQ